jgi:2-dehydropantoate 2-reductase
MAKIALIGPGAVGCTLIAWLGCTNTHQIVICARTPFSVLEVETPEGSITRKSAVLTSPAAASPVDWILVATKTYDVQAALPWLDSLMGPATRLAVLQNGVEHLDRFGDRVPRDVIVPVVVDCPAERIGPGRVRQRGTAFVTVPEGPAGNAFVDLFFGTPVVAAASPDWLTVAWRKLCLNAAGAVSAATLQPAGVVHQSAVADLMRGIVREVVQVGAHVGAKLDDSMVESVIENYRRAPRDGINSLHADRMAGRPMELDARNGVIVRLGRQFGIPTPYNETMVALLSATPVI